MAGTIFVDHQPGTYKVYKTVGGWSILFLDLQGNSRNIDGNHVYPSRQNAYARCKKLNDRLRLPVLDNYLKSPDFKDGVIASTKASWSGSGYSVELFYNGSWRNLWNNSIGNKYESRESIILALPTLDDSDYQKLVNGEELDEDESTMSEEEYFDLAFDNERDELAQQLRKDFQNSELTK